MVAAVEATGVMGITGGRDGTGGIGVFEIDDVRLCVDFFTVGVIVALLSLGCNVRLFLTDGDRVWLEVDGVNTIPAPLFTLPS